MSSIQSGSRHGCRIGLVYACVDRNAPTRSLSAKGTSMKAISRAGWSALVLAALLLSSRSAEAQAKKHSPGDLAIGKLAPEISGVDVDGRKFKLSDYRGKVVVLDFWGDW